MTITFTLFFILCSFFLEQITALDPSPIHPRIIGGHEVEPHSIPYQVFLNVTGTDGSTWICGGSLISQNYVLTTGRCCSGAKSLTVIIGGHDLNKKDIYQVTLESTNFTINPKFTTNVLGSTYVEDIAVVALPKPVKLNDFVKTVRLPNPYIQDMYVNKTGQISGWGLTDGYNESSYSNVLLAQNVRIMDTLRECVNYYYDLHNYDICTEINETNSPCIGDYGSPLTVGDIQVGIASQGIDNCEAYSPFIFSRVSDFLTWIKANTDYEDDYTTLSSTEGTTEVTKPTTTTVSTTPVVTTTDATTTTTGKATRSACLGVMLFITILLSNVAF